MRGNSFADRVEVDIGNQFDVCTDRVPNSLAEISLRVMVTASAAFPI